MCQKAVEAAEREELMEQTIYYQMYQNELEKILPCSEEEQMQLVLRLLQGDVQAKKRLVEGNLGRVISIAEEYADKGVRIEDLVAEGNLALALAVEEYQEGDFIIFAEQAVRSAIEAALTEEDRYDETGANLAAMVNVMNEVSTRLAKEYGREATVKEIAEKMKMEEDQIRELMKIALSAVSVSVPQEKQEEMYLDEDMVSDAEEDIDMPE